MHLSENKTKKSESRTKATIDQLRHPVQEDLKALDKLIAQELNSNVTLINTLTKHILESGGKRLRPLLVILTAHALNYPGDSEHLELAAIIEFIHTATLLHDDVVDHSNQRRGAATANALWGNAASVLTGDFLYSRAFQILARRNNIPVMTVLANTTNLIAEGEVLQLMNCKNPFLTEVAYFDVIRRKTAQLYAAAAEIGARISSEEAKIHAAMHAYGLHLGNAFQIIDDLLDYATQSDMIGKNIGDDLAEGKMTLPLIYAREHGTRSQAALIEKAIQSGGLEHLDAVLEILNETNSFQYTQKRAKEEAHQAQACLAHLSASPFQTTLHTLTELVVNRSF